MEQEIAMVRDVQWEIRLVSSLVFGLERTNARFVLFLLGVVKSFLGTIRAKPMAGLFNDNEEIRGENFNTVDSTRNYRVIHKRIV